jgi:pSer/pThr/pTyr-binding forkhead associated (FHA) protein
VVVRDLGSRLGTYVNGDDVTESVLRSGDLLTLGTASFRARYESRPKLRCRSPLTQRAKFHG